MNTLHTEKPILTKPQLRFMERLRDGNWHVFAGKKRRLNLAWRLKEKGLIDVSFLPGRGHSPLPRWFKVKLGSGEVTSMGVDEFWEGLLDAPTEERA